ncbi:MAG: hypothetical protein WC292_02120 [Clostridia bacterium]
MKDVNKVLLKKATGYTIKETLIEYVIDENGVKRPVKEKQQTKYIPPDINALKTYLELAGGGGTENMSDEDLERERLRLIGTLKSGEDDKENAGEI